MAWRKAKQMSDYNVWAEGEKEEDATVVDAFDAQEAAEKFVRDRAYNHEYLDYFSEGNCVGVTVSGDRLREPEFYEVTTDTAPTFHAEEIF